MPHVPPISAPLFGRSTRRGAALALVLALGLAGCAAEPAPDRVPELTSNAEKARVSQQLAETARKGGDYAGAIDLYRKMLEAGGDPLIAHLGLADSLLAAGVLDKAAEEYTAAIAIAPNKPEPELGLGRLLLAGHRPAEALTAFDAALNKGGSRAAALNGRGLALDWQNDHAAAQQAYRDGLKDAPQDRVLHSNYGLSLALSGDYDGALSQLVPLAQDAQATVRNRQNLALVLGLKGDTEAARLVAQQDLGPDAVESNLKFYEAVRIASSGAAAGTTPPARE
ncbi:hypothetical protein GCM10011611_26920 [Aliidongia dinghuensis]|uniref:Tetratricopeptide repeat protein n=1 Tax=Aliidongia dinghuensis TaxID=1867774 RepID=A0A8J2YV84_9PROT|nr:tetratricopeptide repeat protein [Aliidongia dinghuensis]GGF19588.1 hypothetical protein GCM10011611_26920 [Aliidongia dinghuensis]